jgi:plastocyanin
MRRLRKMVIVRAGVPVTTGSSACGGHGSEDDTINGFIRFYCRFHRSQGMHGTIRLLPES